MHKSASTHVTLGFGLITLASLATIFSALRPLLSNTGAHHRICAQGFGNFWIVPLRPQGAFIGLQQYPRLKLFLGRALAFPDQLFEPFPFVRAQFDNIALLAHLRLVSHELGGRIMALNNRTKLGITVAPGLYPFG